MQSSETEGDHRARYRRCRRPVGRRGQRQDHRPAGREGRRGRALPGRQQRRPHHRQGRRGVQVPPDPLRHPVRGQDLHHRQRGRHRPAHPLRRDRGPARARHRLRQPAHQRRRPPHHAVPPAAGRRQRAAARQVQDRHHGTRHRPVLRGQVHAHRHPRAGPARREDPAPQGQDRAAGEELPAAALRHRCPRPRPGDGRAARLHRALRAVHLRREPAGEHRPRPGQARPLRGRPGRAARHRLRQLSLRDQQQHHRRRSVHRQPAWAPRASTT